MALRISVLLAAGISLIALMFQSLSIQVETTGAQTESPAFNASREILTDVVGTGASQFPMLVVVAFIAGGLAFALILK